MTEPRWYHVLLALVVMAVAGFGFGLLLSFLAAVLTALAGL